MKIKTILGSIGIDKYEHFVLASLCAFVIKNTLMWFVGQWLAALVAFAVVLLFAIGKELIYDRWAGKGACEWRDLWAGIAGAIIGAI